MIEHRDHRGITQRAQRNICTVGSAPPLSTLCLRTEVLLHTGVLKNMECGGHGEEHRGNLLRLD